MIALAAWWNISHGTVMAIQTVEAWNHSRAGSCVNERRQQSKMWNG
jgi:hypothetical protein